MMHGEFTQFTRIYMTHMLCLPWSICTTGQSISTTGRQLLIDPRLFVKARRIHSLAGGSQKSLGASIAIFTSIVFLRKSVTQWWTGIVQSAKEYDIVLSVCLLCVDGGRALTHNDTHM